MTKEEKVLEIIKRLKRIYPHPITALNFRTPFELLIATIMAAQCTDKVVNTVTPELFKKYPDAKAFSKASIEDINKMIVKVVFHNNKAKNISAASKIIDEKYNGKVPDTLKELTSLPGVARKTANVVLGNAFGKNEGIAIDTHVMRLAPKLGLTSHVGDPVKIEEDLMKIVPQKYWSDFSNMLILTSREFYPKRAKDYSSGPLAGLFV
ncbi:endonuclease III [Candidatus Daviesbacteria bacterium]|nr:endonuclease III [Candidatus Daviesbacteria bacterium]